MRYIPIPRYKKTTFQLKFGGKIINSISYDYIVSIVYLNISKEKTKQKNRTAAPTTAQKHPISRSYQTPTTTSIPKLLSTGQTHLNF